MSRHSMRGRHCSSSSGSASYQGISGAASPVYHVPHEPFNHYNNLDHNRKKPEHSYYNVHSKQDCCVKSTTTETPSYQYVDDRKDYSIIDNLTDDESCIDNIHDDDSSLRFQPYYKCDRNDRRYVNNQFSEYESDFPIAHAGNKKYNRDWEHNRILLGFDKVNVQVHNHEKDRNKILNPDTLRNLERVHPENLVQRPAGEIDFHHGTLPRADVSRMSERAHSPACSSVAASAVVDGCGGRCVTFENICSYILQIFFVMGILIGVSLVIAGTILRRTKARDLQVLVYIGAMSAMVCTLLLTVQCRVRRGLRKRKRTIRVACTAVPMGELRPVQQPLMHLPNDNNRVGMHTVNVPINQRRQEMPDEQGIPWWRRTDLPR